MIQNHDPWSEVAGRFEALGRMLQEGEKDTPVVRLAFDALADAVERESITVRDVCADPLVREHAAAAVAAIGRALRASIAALPEPYAHPRVEEELAHPGG